MSAGSEHPAAKAKRLVVAAVAGLVGLLVLGLRILWLAVWRYFETDGEQRAASFAYYAFFALFPLILFFVMIGSSVLDYAEVANRVMKVVGTYIPVVGDDPHSKGVVFDTIEGVVNSRKRAGAIAVLAIVWGSLGFFHALVRGINRAWGTLEYPWWKLPFKNVLMVLVVGSALFVGVIAPVIVDAVQAFLVRQNFLPGARTLSPAFSLARPLIPVAVLFYAFTMFYKFAPRRKTLLAEVWLAALLVAVGLQGLQALFVLYARNFSNFNKFYGAFGGVVAFLMWIYLSGSMIILGGCLCAVAAELKGGGAPPAGGGPGDGTATGDGVTRGNGITGRG